MLKHAHCLLFGFGFKCITFIEVVNYLMPSTPLTQLFLLTERQDLRASKCSCCCILFLD